MIGRILVEWWLRAIDGGKGVCHIGSEQGFGDEDVVDDTRCSTGGVGCVGGVLILASINRDKVAGGEKGRKRGMRNGRWGKGVVAICAYDPVVGGVRRGYSRVEEGLEAENHIGVGRWNVKCEEM